MLTAGITALQPTWEKLWVVSPSPSGDPTSHDSMIPSWGNMGRFYCLHGQQAHKVSRALLTMPPFHCPPKSLLPQSHQYQPYSPSSPPTLNTLAPRRGPPQAPHPTMPPNSPMSTSHLPSVARVTS